MQLEGSSLPEQRTTDWGRRAAGYGTPVPLSRVSLSIAMPRAEFCLLECVRSFLLVSPDSQCTFQRGVCARSTSCLRAGEQLSQNCARDCGSYVRGLVTFQILRPDETGLRLTGFETREDCAD